MVVEVLAQVRNQQRVAYRGIPGDTFEEACQAVWKRMSAPESEPLFRLFFESYGIALRHPRLYKAFLNNTIEDWLRLMTGSLVNRIKARRRAPSPLSSRVDCVASCWIYVQPMTANAWITPSDCGYAR